MYFDPKLLIGQAWGHGLPGFAFFCFFGDLVDNYAVTQTVGMRSEGIANGITKAAVAYGFKQSSPSAQVMHTVYLLLCIAGCVHLVWPHCNKLHCMSYFLVSVGGPHVVVTFVWCMRHTLGLHFGRHWSE